MFLRGSELCLPPGSAPTELIASALAFGIGRDASGEFIPDDPFLLRRVP